MLCILLIALALNVNENLMRKLSYTQQYMGIDNIELSDFNLENLTNSDPCIFLEMSDTQSVDEFILRINPLAFRNLLPDRPSVSIYLYSNLHYKNSHINRCVHRHDFKENLQVHCHSKGVRYAVIAVNHQLYEERKDDYNETYIVKYITDVEVYAREWEGASLYVDTDNSSTIEYDTSFIVQYNDVVYGAQNTKKAGAFFMLSGNLFLNETMISNNIWFEVYFGDLLVYREPTSFFNESFKFMVSEHHPGPMYNAKLKLVSNFEDIRLFNGWVVNDIKFKKSRNIPRAEHSNMFYIYKRSDLSKTLFTFEEPKQCTFPYVRSMRRHASLIRFLNDMNPYYKKQFESNGIWLNGYANSREYHGILRWRESDIGNVLENNKEYQLTDIMGTPLKNRFHYLNPSYKSINLDESCLYMDHMFKWRLGDCNAEKLVLCSVGNVNVEMFKLRKSDVDIFDYSTFHMPEYSYIDSAVDFDNILVHPNLSTYRSVDYYTPFPINEFEILNKEIQIRFTFYLMNTKRQHYIINCKYCQLSVTNEHNKTVFSEIIETSSRFIVGSLSGISLYDLRVQCEFINCPVTMYRLKNGLWDFPRDSIISFGGKTIQDSVNIKDAIDITNPTTFISILNDLIGGSQSWLESIITGSFNFEACLCPSAQTFLKICLDSTQAPDLLFNLFVCLRDTLGITQEQDIFECDASQIKNKACAQSLTSLYAGFNKIDTLSSFTYQIRSPIPYVLDVGSFENSTSVSLLLSYPQHCKLNVILEYPYMDFTMGINYTQKSILQNELCPPNETEWPVESVQGCQNNKASLDCYELSGGDYSQFVTCDEVVGYTCCIPSASDTCQSPFKLFVRGVKWRLGNGDINFQEEIINNGLTDILDSKRLLPVQCQGCATYNEDLNMNITLNDIERRGITIKRLNLNSFIRSSQDGYYYMPIEEDEHVCYPDPNSFDHLSDRVVNHWDHDTCNKIKNLPDAPIFNYDDLDSLESNEAAYANKVISWTTPPFQDTVEMTCAGAKSKILQQASEEDFGVDKNVLDQWIYCSSECAPCNKEISTSCGYDPFTGIVVPQVCGFRGCTSQHVQDHFNEYRSLVLISDGRVQEIVITSCANSIDRFRVPCPTSRRRRRRRGQQKCYEAPDRTNDWEYYPCTSEENYVAYIDGCATKHGAALSVSDSFYDNQIQLWNQENNNIDSCMSNALGRGNGISDYELSELTNPHVCPFITQDEFERKINNLQIEECDVSKRYAQHCCWTTSSCQELTLMTTSGITGQLNIVAQYRRGIRRRRFSHYTYIDSYRCHEENCEVITYCNPVYTQ